MRLRLFRRGNGGRQKSEEGPGKGTCRTSHANFTSSGRVGTGISPNSRAVV